MEKRILDGIAKALDIVGEYEGVMAKVTDKVENGVMFEVNDEDYCETFVRGKEYDSHLALFTFVKLIEDGVIYIKCKDEDNKDWKYLMKLIGVGE